MSSRMPPPSSHWPDQPDWPQEPEPARSQSWYPAPASPSASDWRSPSPDTPSRWAESERPLPDLSLVDADTWTGAAVPPDPAPSLPGYSSPWNPSLADVADIETVPQPAAPGGARRESRALASEETARLAAHPPRRASRLPVRQVPSWAARLAVAIGLVLLGVRAGLASAQFMRPGGDIIGWSQPPKVVCTLCGLAPTPTEHELTPAEYAAFLAERMPLDDALGQMIMIQFYQSDATPDLIQMITTQRVGGALLLGRPVQPVDKTLNPQLQKLASIPLLLAIDQEGGYVNRFQDVAGHLPGASEMHDPATAQASGEQAADLLHTYGYNLNFAPMADLGIPNPVFQFIGRTFGEDPSRVATLAGAYLRGLQESGRVAGTLKHFPGGLVATGADPHIVMPSLARSRTEWEATDLAPYRTLLATGDVHAIMVSHEMIPAVDPRLPTSLSPAVITDTLRDELGFDGVVITDDLHMRALNAQWSVWDAGVLSVEAGADVIGQMATPQEVQNTVDALKQAIASGKLTRARINDSVRRILTLKLALGLIAMPDQGHSRRNDTGPHPQPVSLRRENDGASRP